MKSNRKMNLLLSLAGLFLGGGLLGAADVNGSFTLPLQTHWGSAVLPAGDYTFSLDHAMQNGQIIVRRGNDGVAVVLAQGMDVTSYSASATSSMLIVGNRVRSLHLAPVGLTYTYSIHPERKELLAGRSGVPGVSVLVKTK
ncbi:MAG TPA: hypothetical protein VLJ11_15040 [Bryobacteraceae bacterium]|nr:hypothetical protein [Bryobacteraceae bacterium]